MKCDKYIGMDVHQAMTVVVVLDADGRVILETMVPTEAAAIIRLVQRGGVSLDIPFHRTLAVLHPSDVHVWMFAKHKATHY
jgi:hypothetical protein